MDSQRQDLLEIAKFSNGDDKQRPVNGSYDPVKFGGAQFFTHQWIQFPLPAEEAVCSLKLDSELYNIEISITFKLLKLERNPNPLHCRGFAGDLDESAMSLHQS